MIQRLQITKGETFKYRSEETQTIQYGVEFVEDNRYRNPKENGTIVWSVTEATGVSIDQTGLLTIDPEVPNNTEVEIRAECNGFVATCPLKIFDMPDFTDVPYLPVEEQVEALKKASQLALRPLIVNGELSEEEMQEVIDVFPVYKVGVNYKAGDIFRHNRSLYEVIQGHTSQDDWKPEDTPALYKNHTPVGEIEEWRQPLGAHDAYKIGDVVWFEGKKWHCIKGDANGNNVWRPDVFGWELLEENGNEYPVWKQPEGQHDAYVLNDIVWHNGKLWICTQTDANGFNVWAPGVYGWIEYTP